MVNLINTMFFLIPPMIAVNIMTRCFKIKNNKTITMYQHIKAFISSQGIKMKTHTHTLNKIECSSIENKIKSIKIQQGIGIQ